MFPAVITNWSNFYMWLIGARPTSDHFPAPKREYLGIQTFRNDSKDLVLALGSERLNRLEKFTLDMSDIGQVFYC